MLPQTAIMQTTSNSLLQRLAGPASPTDWATLDAIYRPYVRRWILRLGSSVNAGEVDDLVQEVLAVVVARIPAFRHGHIGTFRAWLKQIVLNRIRDYLKTSRKSPRGVGGPLAECPLAQVEDPNSELSR